MVVPDRRFPDQVETIRCMGGVVVHARPGRGCGIVSHVSDQGDFEVDATIATDNTKTELPALQRR